MKRSFSLVTIATCELLLLMSLSTTVSFAQSIVTNYGSLSSIGQGGLSISMSPQYPTPGQTVSFSLEDYQDNLNTSTIVWSINGTVSAKGVGDTTFQTTAGVAGSQQTVSVSVTTQTGVTLTQSAIMAPAGVDLLWQAHSYVPPFYRGKALFPLQGTVTVTAMPTFALTNPQNAVYSWELDGEAMPGISGNGKNTVTLTGSILLKPINLSVTVTSEDGSATAQNSISLSGISPTIVLYQESPLYGLLLNEAAGSAFTLTGQVGLNAVPYFFDSTAPFTNTANFQWSINNQPVSGQFGQVLNVAPPQNQNGTSSVSVTATNSTKVSQTGSASVNIGFNGQ